MPAPQASLFADTDATTMTTSPHWDNSLAVTDVDWNPAQVYVDLQAAHRILTGRGWKIAAKWAAEMWMGLPGVELAQVAALVPSDPSLDESRWSSSPSSSSQQPQQPDPHEPLLAYARTLLDLGEYAHAAAVLSQPQHCSPNGSTGGVERVPPPLADDLPPAAVATRAYALYLAGERRKEEAHHEHQGKTTPHIPNPYLEQLNEELLEYYENETLDAFGLHVYGMVLLASGDKAPLPPHTPAPQTVLMRSILSFPYNWSAWLDLAECAIQAGADGEAAIEEGLQPVLSGHWMYHFFCAHLQAHGHANHGQALQIYRKWSEPGLFGGSPYLLTECALAHYHLRQFADAQHILQGLHVDMPYRLESMDIYSNILYVQEDAVALSQLAHVAVQVDQYRPETSCIVGNYYSLKQQRAKAIQAFQRALALDRTYVSAWTLMGHEYVEWKQTAHAMEAYRQAVHVAPKDYRAWYGLGQTYEFLSMYLYALYYYKQATTFRPHDARMWCSIGQVLVHLGRQKDAIRAYERALQLDDAEGVATLKLAHLYNELNLSDKAAACYARHLQLRYVASQGPGKATAISDLPPLEVLLPHIVVQEPEAEALLYLAQYHTREAGDYETASVLASRLLEYPGPEKEQAKALLREIRSRHNKSSGAAAPPPPRRVYQTRSRGPPTESFDFSP